MTRDVPANVLIVEDKPEWRSIYEAQARDAGVAAVRMAGTLTEAVRHIDEMEFDVAFVDIGLDNDDDRNVDGLRVMEKIRSVGDATSIIVVTGRTGSDVLPIAREAIKIHNAFDTVGKAEIGPVQIRALLGEAIKEFKSNQPKVRVYHELRGNRTAWDWDDTMMRLVGIKSGIQSLYGFLDQLAGRLLPLIEDKNGLGIRVHAESRTAVGEYWSRRLGRPVLLSFGLSPSFESGPNLRNWLADISGSKLGEKLGTNGAGSVQGAIFELLGRVRSDYRELGDL